MSDPAQDKETAFALAAKASTAQKVYYTVTPEANRLLSCQGLGGQIVALGDFLKQLAKDQGEEVHTLISGINTDEQGVVSFEIVICPEHKEGGAAE